MADKRRYRDRRDYLIQAVHRRRRSYVKEQLHIRVDDARFVVMTNVLKLLNFIIGMVRKKILVSLKKVTRAAGLKRKSNSINASCCALIVTAKSMPGCCSFHEKSWLKNRVNSGKPKFRSITLRCFESE
jgi:hypothetical protein